MTKCLNFEVLEIGICDIWHCFEILNFKFEIIT